MFDVLCVLLLGKNTPRIFLRFFCMLLGKWTSALLPTSESSYLFKKNSQQIYTWDQKGYKKCGFVKDIAPSKTNPAIQPRFISVGVPKHHNMLIALFPKHLKAENIETHWKKILSKIGDIESSFIYPAAVSIINSIFRTNYDSSPLNFFS